MSAYSDVCGTQRVGDSRRKVELCTVGANQPTSLHADKTGELQLLSGLHVYLEGLEWSVCKMRAKVNL